MEQELPENVARQLRRDYLNVKRELDWTMFSPAINGIRVLETGEQVNTGWERIEYLYLMGWRIGIVCEDAR